MSKKDEGEIEIAVTLNLLPAKDVFTLLTTPYPAKMADEFIVNIVNSIFSTWFKSIDSKWARIYYGAEIGPRNIEVENEHPTADDISIKRSR